MKNREIMSEWKEYSLGELLEITSSKRIMRSEYTSQGIPFYRSKEIIELTQGNKISTKLFISDNRFNDIKNKFGVPVENDILLTSVGTLGIPYLVNKDDIFYFKDGNLTWFKNFSNKLNSKFLFYWFSSVIGKKQIDNIAIGSTQKALTIASLKKIVIKLPPIEYQEIICSILSKIDKKIALNTQTNQTLEAIAQAIFKHWFIDFAPVHAKAEVLAAGGSAEDAELAAMASLSGKTLDAITALAQSDPDAYQTLRQTAQAFPSAFTDSELGLVPEGWEVKPINEVCRIIYGKGLPKKQLKQSGYPVYGANGIIGYNDRYLYEERQVLIGCRGTVGKVSVSKPFSYITSNSLVIEYQKENLNLYFLENHLKNFDLSMFASGSVQAQITIQDLSKLKIMLPEKTILDKFYDQVNFIYSLIYKNHDKNITLSETRDTLLPKLLNGEIEL
ncbi:restriction endonuclease subunit S [Avibacterium sp. 21-599]|uniref:restriction endonuclease subunit S n=1 Tax=Avibacterium sp. 21-599 TaxID=2911528 RepID=UPI0022486EA0|nr:restriction endonuclease subunit S [Avibacterium sp. 21-599]MCW9716990.1 restriction endonuclease subunit S [Avibacterium sp. 21-599]